MLEGKVHAYNDSPLMDTIVNFTPTGAVASREQTPHVPIEVSEIIEEVHQAVEIGITMVHLHARCPESGRHTYQREEYRKIIEGIRDFSPDLVVCVSLSGRSVREVELRADPLELEGDAKPDMGSLTLTSMNFAHEASVNSPATVRELAERMLARGVLAELEAFDLGSLNYARYLEKKKLIRPPHYFNLLFGNIASAQTKLIHIGVMLAELPQPALWSLAGLGAEQLKAHAIAIACQGGVRVGLEDNLWLDPARSKLATNTDLLRRVHRLAALHDRRIMDAGELRRRLELEPGNGRYGRAAA